MSYDFVSGDTAVILSGNGIVVVNLDGPVTDQPSIKNIDLVNLSNKHILNKDIQYLGKKAFERSQFN